MADLTRRKFLGLASLGVAAAGATLGIVSRVAPSVLGVTSQRYQTSPIGEPVLAQLRNVKTGEIAVMTGNREIVFQDRDLVDRLLSGAQHAAGR